MAPETDVRAHMQTEDVRPEGPNQAPSGANSAWTPVTRDTRGTHARVIPIRPEVRQEQQPKKAENSRPAKPRGLEAELSAASRALAGDAADSDWDRPLMTPVRAFTTITPRRGEAANWIIWSGMTVAGLARVLLVSLGYLIARGGDTRIKAAVVLGVFTIVMILAWLAGQQPA